MRPDGSVVAMVGGRDYAKSPFNRAVQARRQPGSTFKLFVYLAALRAGMDPDSTVLDEPITIGDWSPKNNNGRYAGAITLTQAFARSSNVASARLTKEVGVRNVIRAARDLGVTSPIPEEATIALGTSTMSLLELTSAYAAVASGRYPVRPRGLAEEDEPGWLDRLRGRDSSFGSRELDGLRTLLAAGVAGGTGNAAALSVRTFGKTGTTQDNFANDLIVGVWVGNDDNTPNPGLSGGGVPARIWRSFMVDALGVSPPPVVEQAAEDPVGNLVDEFGDGLANDLVPAIEGEIEGLGVNLRLGRDGSIDARPADDPRDAPREAPPRDDRRPPPEEEEEGP
jgi:penicillin-binding protein 1A